MFERVQLPLKTAEGRPLMHKFYRQVESVEGLLITFPGGNYGIDGPMLYYPSELLVASGWDSLALTYGYQSSMEPFAMDTIPGLLRECRGAVETVLAEREYPRIGLVGKSLGAGVVAHLIQTDPSLASARAVYLTPPLGKSFYDPIFMQTEGPALLAVGTKDRFYDPEALESLRAVRPFELILVEGADHSMDIVGDLGASIDAVKRVTNGVLAFLLGD